MFKGLKNGLEDMAHIEASDPKMQQERDGKEAILLLDSTPRYNILIFWCCTDLHDKASIL